MTHDETQVLEILIELGRPATRAQIVASEHWGPYMTLDRVLVALDRLVAVGHVRTTDRPEPFGHARHPRIVRYYDTIWLTMPAAARSG